MAVIGYRYFVGMHMIACHGPVDRVRKIIVGEKVAWEGSATSSTQIVINKPKLFGGRKGEGGVAGAVDFMFGDADQEQNGYLAAMTDPSAPAYRGLFSIVLRQCLVSMMTPYIKPWKPEVTRFPKGWYEEKAAIGTRDANPAHIIVECLTNREWGLGYTHADLNLESFEAAADTLYDEAFGLSLLWEKQSKVHEFIQLILTHIDGALFVDPATGLFTLRLIRNDFIPGSLPLFSQDQIVSVDSFSRSTPSDMPNTLTLRYVDRNGKTQSVSVHDIGSLDQTGQTVSTNIDMPGITTKELAVKVAMRELGQVARPLIKMTLTVTRAASSLKIGDAIRLTSPDHSLNQQVMRVVGISYGTLRDGSIRLELLEDAFSLPQYSFIVPDEDLWESPYTDPEAAANRALIEAPFWEIVRTLTGEAASSQVLLEPLAGVLMVGATALAQDVSSYDVYTRQGPVPFEEEVTGYPTPSGTLQSALDMTATEIVLANRVRLDEVEMPPVPPLILGPWVEQPDPIVWAIIDPGTATEEIIGIAELDVDTGEATIIRGALDTVPHPHASGARVFFLRDGSALSTTQYLQGEVVDVKVLPETANGLLDVEVAPTDEFTFTGRATRPYPPGNFKINGSSYPATIAGTLSVSWAHRNRLAQTAYIVAQDEGNIGPEPGTTYTLRFYNEAGSLLHVAEEIVGTSYTWSSETTDLVCLEFDGADGSTSFTDAGGIVSWTANGNAQVSTTLPKIGTGSLLLDGDGDYLSAASSAYLNFGTNDFTIEAWVNPSALANNYATIFGTNTASFTTNSRFLMVYGASAPVATQRKFALGGLGLGGGNNLITSTTEAVAGTWYHVAVTREGDTFRMFVNGVLESTVTSTEPMNFAHNGTRIGSNGWDGAAGFFAGKIDQLRVRALCAYTEDFTPPTAVASVTGVLNDTIRVELTSVVDGRESHQAHEWIVARE